MAEFRKKRSTSITGIELKFVTAFLLNPNVKAAAESVGVCYRTGNRYLKKDYIQKYIDEKRDEVSKRCEITLEDVINELKKIAFFRHDEYAENFEMAIEEGKIGVTLKDFKKMDTSAIAIMNQKINAQGIPYVEIKPYNKVEALKILLEHMKGYQGPKELHLHLEEKRLKDMSAQEVAAQYQIMVSGED